MLFPAVGHFCPNVKQIQGTYIMILQCAAREESSVLRSRRFPCRRLTVLYLLLWIWRKPSISSVGAADHFCYCSLATSKGLRCISTALIQECRCFIKIQTFFFSYQTAYGQRLHFLRTSFNKSPLVCSRK